jgi:hypothetical protein
MTYYNAVCDFGYEAFNAGKRNPIYISEAFKQ